MVDVIHSGTYIANHFKIKHNTLYNSGTLHSTLMDSLRNRLDLNVHINYNADSNNGIHCHVITKFDVMKSIRKLKQDNVNADGMLLSENVINRSDLLFVNVSLLFTVMLSHSFDPPDFVIIAGSIPIPRGARVALNDSENYRTIAISSLLGKIIDHIIINHRVHFKYIKLSVWL